MNISRMVVNEINNSPKNQHCFKNENCQNMNLPSTSAIHDNIIIKDEIEDETMEQLPCSSIKIEKYNTGITEAITNFNEFTNYPEMQNLNHDSIIMKIEIDEDMNDESKNCRYESIERNEVNNPISINDQYSNVFIKQEVIDEDRNHDFENLDNEMHVRNDIVETPNLLNVPNYNNITIKEEIPEDMVSVNNDAKSCDNIKQEITEPNNLLHQNFEESDDDVDKELQIAKEESPCSSIDQNRCEDEIHIKDEIIEYPIDRVQQNREMYKDFSIKKYLENLARIESEQKEYNCGFCGEGFSEKCSLMLHYKEHPDYYPYKCQYCNKKLKSEKSLRTHKEFHTGEVLHMCKLCNKRLISIHALKSHMRTHDEKNLIKCDMCEEKLHRSMYKTHMKTHSGSKLYKCIICGARYGFSSGLACHMTKHTGALECNICHKRLGKKSCYERHMSTHMTYECADCGRKYSTKKWYDFHLKAHTVKDAYGCILCQKSFSDRLILRQHMETHKNDKRVECKICDKKFREHSLLNKHMKMHFEK